MYVIGNTNVSYFALCLRLINKEILDRLKVVRYQETLLVFNENVDMAMAHVSVSCSATVSVCCLYCFFCKYDRTEFEITIETKKEDFLLAI